MSTVSSSSTASSLISPESSECRARRQWMSFLISSGSRRASGSGLLFVRLDAFRAPPACLGEFFDPEFRTAALLFPDRFGFLADRAVTGVYPIPDRRIRSLATSATASSFRRRLAPAPKTRIPPPLGSSTTCSSRRPAGSGRRRRGDQCDHFVPAFPCIPVHSRSRSRNYLIFLRVRSGFEPEGRGFESLPACQ